MDAEPRACPRHTQRQTDCHLCCLAASRQDYRDMWGIPGRADPADPCAASPPAPKPAAPFRRALCLHLGKRIEFRPGCGGWNCVHWCDKGRPDTTPGGNCQTCPEYEADTPEVTERVRHCLYYVCPIRTGDGPVVWRMRLGELKQRAALFDGRRVVAVAEGAGGPELEPVAAVADYLGDGWEIVPVANDASRRETVAWEPLWARLEGGHGPDDAAFFGHAKGVTKPLNDGVTVHPWARVMLETCLDYWPLVREQLEKYPITGSFKKTGYGFNGSRSKWHYSGTFYWVRLLDFFARDWRGLLDRAWWGTESYPGVAYAPAEGGCLFLDGLVPAVNLYTMPRWKVVEGEYEKWRGKNAGYRSPIG